MPQALESVDFKLFHSRLSMPLVKLPVTTSLIKLSNEKTILISPHPSLTAEDFQSMGNVTDIVAPSLMHHLGIKNAVSALPQAKLWGALGLEQKRKDIAWSHFLDEKNWPYNNELVAIHLAGMPKMNEFAFFHKATKTLFVTDLCFNILDDAGLGGWLIYNIFGTYKRLAVNKLFLKGVSNQEAFKKSLSHLFSYDFEDIVVCHGAVVKGGGRAKLRAALQERGYDV
jgi:hypothetical protein